MEKISNCSLVIVFLTNILNFVLEIAPKLAILNALNFLDIDLLHGKFEILSNLFPFLTTCINLDNHPWISIINQVENIVPIIRDFIRLNFFKDNDDLVLDLIMFVASNLDIITFGVCDCYANDILIFVYLLKVALNVRDKLIIHLILVFVNNTRHEVSRISGFVLEHILELDDILFFTRNHKTCS